MRNYIVAASKGWFFENIKSPEYSKLSIYNISRKEELTLDLLQNLNPRYIFFPHWSWRVPAAIFENYECVAFHTAPLPYGRGGSPIQNLIIRNFTESPINALRMTSTLDGGPIYCSENISLEGSIEEIFKRASNLVEKMIIHISKSEPIPTAQQGDPFAFDRLSEEDNALLETYNISEIYNRIRMVDGLDYPRAYIDFPNFKLIFSKAHLENGVLSASVTFAPK